MLAPLLCLVLVQGAPVEVRLSAEPATVEIGQPFELRLDVWHPADGPTPRLDDGSLELDESWVEFEDERALTSEVRAEDERLLTRHVYRIASLEPGTREISPSSAVLLEEAVQAVIPTKPLRIEVAGVLGAEEDAPRPLRGFPPDFLTETYAAERNRLALAVVGIGALSFLVGLALLFRARRRRPESAATPSVAERFQSLESTVGLQEADVLATHFQLSRLLREAADERLERGEAGDAHAPGWTDDEWLQVVRSAAHIDARTKEELSRTIERCAAVKYAGTRPTPWAIEETFRHARAALQGLGRTGEEG